MLYLTAKRVTPAFLLFDLVVVLLLFMLASLAVFRLQAVAICCLKQAESRKELIAEAANSLELYRLKGTAKNIAFDVKRGKQRITLELCSSRSGKQLLVSRIVAECVEVRGLASDAILLLG